MGIEMSGAEAKKMVTLELELQKARLQISEQSQLLQIYEKQARRKCATCSNCRRADCYTLYECPYLGYVDLRWPGCGKWKERSNVQD